MASVSLVVELFIRLWVGAAALELLEALAVPLALVPGGGLINAANSAAEKLFSMYSLPWLLYMCTLRL